MAFCAVIRNVKTVRTGWRTLPTFFAIGIAKISFYAIDNTAFRFPRLVQELSIFADSAILRG